MATTKPFNRSLRHTYRQSRASSIASTSSSSSSTSAVAYSKTHARPHDHQNAMEPLVYEDTPLASYFEGEAIPFELPNELTPPHTPFAPKGLSHFKKRSSTVRKRRMSIAPTSIGQLLERFRYIIVASQLLTDDAGPRPQVPKNDLSTLEATSVTGAAAIAVGSFLAAWALHWLRTRRIVLEQISWMSAVVYLIGIIALGIGAVHILQRLYIKYIQRSAIEELSRFVDESHSFDTVASNSIRFIQEVEVVARGYDLSTPLPPVSRLEDRQTIRRCRTLRAELANTLREMTVLLVESHSAVQPFVSDIDLQRYHDIYEVSLVEYSQAIELGNETSSEIRDSLKELRFAIRLHALARKVFLCDLLALKQTKYVERLQQWTSILRLVRDVGAETCQRQQSLAKTLSAEEWGTSHKQTNRNSTSDLSQADSDTSLPENQTLKSQNRRFDEVATAIRALNAKAHLLREEINGLSTANTEDNVISASMQKHYEALGADIQSLVAEWERGRNTMRLNIDTDRATATQYSRSSSSIRSPISPSPSVGNGLMIVDGGPAEALQLLNGDFDPYAPPNSIRKSLGMDLPDEEIFEAMSKPFSHNNKRMSLSGMSREEKMAKLQEDRRKRATLQEQADNTTNMLRELRMVMKHRPRASVAGPTAGLCMTPTSMSGDESEQPQRVTSM